MVLDLRRLAELGGDLLFRFFPILGDDVVTEIDAFIADIDRRPCDQLADLITALSAERAAQMQVHLLLFRHAASYFSLPSFDPPSLSSSLAAFGGRVITSSISPYFFASSPDMK